MKDDILKFREIMRIGMIENFKNDGFLQPVFFFLKDDQPVFMPIPENILTTVYEKEKLGLVIKSICKQKDVSCAGLIIEAYSRAFHQNDPLCHIVMEGNARISDLKQKQDIIMMVFSSPESEEIIVYNVNPSKKTIEEKLESKGDVTGGIFSNFFEWHK